MAVSRITVYTAHYVMEQERDQLRGPQAAPRIKEGLRGIEE